MKLLALAAIVRNLFSSHRPTLDFIALSFVGVVFFPIPPFVGVVLFPSPSI